MQTAHVNINKEERGNRMYIIQFIRGFCMALADSVPGSGRRQRDVLKVFMTGLWAVKDRKMRQQNFLT